MVWRTRGACALLLGTSTFALVTAFGAAGRAQEALDPITVIATKTEEKAVDTLASVSVIRQQQLTELMPDNIPDVFMGTPNVWFQVRGDDPGAAINIRGLQDFGRVAVVIDGARQNFQRTGHNADGLFYLDPELIAGADVVRGPVANIYGSGAIGGVVSFRTKDVDDVLKPGEKYGIVAHGILGSNMFQNLSSLFGAVRVNENVEIFGGGTYRYQTDYRDGDGNIVKNTGQDIWTGIAKVTLRPADGHEVKFTGINYEANYKSGQDDETIYNNHVVNQIAAARWRYSRPDDRVFDFDGNVYWTRTVSDQTLLNGALAAVGETRSFAIDTTGFDLANSSRFDTGPVQNTLTIGGDAFRDRVNTEGFYTVYTPSGERTVAGAFVQLKSKYSNWLEVIGALRYDSYSLKGGDTETSGDRLSPKITVGITPITAWTFYGTYAEGYRAPSVTETLVSGTHPPPAIFDFLPNPSLKPEVGKNKEFGVNVKYDSVFKTGDKIRAKFSVFRNDVEDYIELVAVPAGPAAGGIDCVPPWFIPVCYQYQNIHAARLQGVEFEGNYDAGNWFAGLQASLVNGKNSDTGEPLAKIPPAQVTTTLGGRFYDQKLTVALRWQWVAAKNLNDIPGNLTDGYIYYPTKAYNLVNLYVGYQVNENILAALSIENLLNQQYARYMDVYPATGTSPFPEPFYQPGITIKGSLKMRFADGIATKG